VTMMSTLSPPQIDEEEGKERFFGL